MGVIEKNYQMMVDRGRITKEQKDMVMGLITPTLHMMIYLTSILQLRLSMKILI